MAIFKKDTKEEKKEDVKTEKESTVVKAGSKKGKTPFHVRKKKGRRQTTVMHHATDLSKVLLRPRITEKASFAIDNRSYVFEIALDATKKDVEKAVEEYYKVKPIKINLVKIPTKKRINRRTRKVGVSSRGKKAYVFLKEGDSIEFV